MNQEYLKKYARLLVVSGLNVQNNQIVVIKSPLEGSGLVHHIVDECYKAHAKDVIVKYQDEIITHKRYLYSDPEIFKDVPDYDAEFYNQTSKEKACYLTLVGDDPDLMKDVDPSRMMDYQKAFRSKTKPYRNRLDYMECQWCIGAVPSLNWAKKIYPDLDDEVAIEMLWDAIFKVCRIDEKDPVENWNRHRASFEKNVRILNEMDIDHFVYTNSLGTNLKVGMPEDYIFCGGGSYLNDGTYYFPNIPTEEVFSMPHRLQVNGRLVASMPLVYNGNRIEDFWFEFKDGKVIDFDAKMGKDVLENLLNADEGARYLGEIALVPYSSPIKSLDTLFYETLIDENASCHFALGQSYPECIKEGLNQTDEELKERGANQSLIHVDFMVGTKDLQIKAITRNNQEIDVFTQGNFSLEFD